MKSLRQVYLNSRTRLFNDRLHLAFEVETNFTLNQRHFTQLIVDSGRLFTRTSTQISKATNNIAYIGSTRGRLEHIQCQLMST